MFNLYRFYIKFEKFYAAIKDFEKALEIDPNYKEAYRGKGVCYSRLGDNDLAIKNYKKAIEKLEELKNILKLIGC